MYFDSHKKVCFIFSLCYKNSKMNILNKTFQRNLCFLQSRRKFICTFLFIFTKLIFSGLGKRIFQIVDFEEGPCGMGLNS